MSGQSHGPQASRLYAHLRGGAGRSERAMTILDLLRTRGPLSTTEVRDALGHSNTSTVGRYLGDLRDEGLVEVTVPARSGRLAQSAVWAITEHGRTIV